MFIGFLKINSKLEIIQMSINRQVDKQIVLYPYNEILLNNKKEYILDTCNNMDE